MAELDLAQALGGWAKCRELSTAFYARVSEDPVLSPLFPGKTYNCAIEELAAFLVQLLGGPSKDAERRWWLSLRESHLRFRIGPSERKAWLKVMAGTLRDVEMSQPMRSALMELFEDASAHVLNTGPPVALEPHQPGAPDVQLELRRRWEQQRALDEAVAEVGLGAFDRVTAVVEGPLLKPCFERSRSVFAQFLSVLIHSRNITMSEYASQILHANPDLAHERYSGRTLLHAASAAGNLPMVAELLKQGVNPNVQDQGGHTPLYSVANECAGGRDVVRALVQAGASVDACDGVKRCTALHMAARRDNVEVAEALLHYGANLEARDSLAETPLRRAVNCGKTSVAKLLLSRGADPLSVGSKGLTPLAAARTKEMRSLF